ncbi:MAG: hypothetical protein DHS20C09_04150 [marine bacterium B5-7]|nr:MAG: hypothetical protein DHS20C09_04150 [marine bacterium B5-7]
MNQIGLYWTILIVMLMQFKYKQRKIASITISLFMGSWLLLLCQTCFAANDDINNYNESSTEILSSCHVSENTTLDQVNTVDDEHCLGACDCDAMTITFSSEKNSELKEKAKYSADLFAYVTPDIIFSTRAPPNYRISEFPDRAILLPLHSYNVLLI